MRCSGPGRVARLQGWSRRAAGPLSLGVRLGGAEAAEGVRVVDQLHAVAIATRFLVSEMPDVAFREVWATRHDGQWLVSFGKVLPPDVVESPGGYAVAVDAVTGRPEWLPVL